MVEIAATAIGISGVVSVLQSLLQCYKDFLVVRDFCRDYETRILRLDLLQLSVKNWGISVGLIDEFGSPQQRFHVLRRTEGDIKAAERSLEHIKTLFDNVDEVLSIYKQESPSTPQLDEHYGVETLDPEDGKRWKVRRKIHRIIHKKHDQQHPGTIKRGQWALVDKEIIDRLIDDITATIGLLLENFPPTDQTKQHDLYHAEIVKMELSDEELVILKDIAQSTDLLLAQAAERTTKERETGHSYRTFDTTDDSTAILGDFVADGQKRSGVGSTFEDITTARGSVVMAGNNFGGKSPLEVFLEAKTAKTPKPTTEVSRSDEH